jgi:hypothetical protein
LRVGLDRGGKDVPVDNVGQVQHLDQRFVTSDEHIPDCLVHQFSGAIELAWIEIGPVLLEVTKRLIENLVGPFRLNQTSLSDTDQQVAQAVRIENVGVVEDDERHLSTDPCPG